MTSCPGNRARYTIINHHAQHCNHSPYGGVEIALLRGFQDVVVGVALQPDLRGHIVEAVRALFRTRERHVRDGARNAPVAVIERMDGDEPHMRQRRLQNGIEYGLIVEPLQKGFNRSGVLSGADGA